MAYNALIPADTEFIANGPADIRQNQEALRTGQIVDALTVKGLSTGNASGNIPVSNGTINTNLNAEKLGGYFAAAFASASHVHGVATTSSNGFMANTDVTKLATIAVGAEVNQNAFSNIVAGSETLQADNKTDTFTIAAGTNISITPDTVNDKVTIGVNGTVASAATAAACTGNAATASDITTGCLNDTLSFPLTTFRTSIFGSSANGIHAKPFRILDVAGGAFGSGFAWGANDTHGFIHTSYNAAVAFIGGGGGDAINWYKQLAFMDSTVANATNATTAAACTGNSATATNATTAAACTGNSATATSAAIAAACTGNAATASDITTGYLNDSVVFPLTTFRTDIFGSSANGAHLRPFRCKTYGGISYAAGVAFGMNDTQGYLHVTYGDGLAYIGGGGGNNISWQKSIAWKDDLTAIGSGIIASSLGLNGYIKFSNGLIIQWGRGIGNNSNFPASITFPIAFNTFLYAGQPAYLNPNSADPSVSVYSCSNIGLSFVSNSGTLWTFTWFAIGI